MDDLISRQAALNAIEKTIKVNSSIHYEMRYWEDGMNCAKNILEDLPSVQPERKKGKWEVQPSAGEDRPFIWWKCSECGHVIFSETERDRREFHAFCGRCGADMRGEANEHD